MEFKGCLCMQVEYKNEDWKVSIAVGKPEAVREILWETNRNITRVLLRERTKEDEEYMRMWIKQDMLGYYLLQDMEDVLTSHQN